MAPQQSRPGSARRPSPEVYRRRRIVVGVALLVVLALLVWAVVAIAGIFTGGQDDNAGAPAPSTASAPSSAPSSPGTASSESAQASSGQVSGSAAASGSTDPSSSAEAAAKCAPEDIGLESATDKSTYAAGDDPVLEMKITNSGSEDCSLNVGTSQQEFKIVSGSDRIFSTTDCRTDATDSDMTLKAGATESARFTWNRLRSAPGCKPVSTKPRPGTYSFTAKLGAVDSDKTNFTLK